MYRIARFMLIVSSLCLSPLALASTVVSTPQGAASTSRTPAPDSRKSIYDLLEKSYREGAASVSQGMMPQLPEPQTVLSSSAGPVLGMWPQNAIDTISSAAFIAAWGFALGMVMMGIAALLLAVRRK